MELEPLVMRKVLTVLSSFILLSILFACGGGGGGKSRGGGDGDSDGTQKTVAISFDLSLSDTVDKNIAYNHDPDYYNDIEFWYKAIPVNPAGDGTSVSGDTRNASGKDDRYFIKLTFVDSGNKIPASISNPSGTVGYFTEGQWAFDIEVRKPVDNSSYAVLWKTSTTVTTYIESSKTIEFILSKHIDSSRKGTVNFDISVLKTSDTDYFEVYFTDLAGNNPIYVTDADGLIKGESLDGTMATLTGSPELDCGLYILTINYYSGPGEFAGGGVTDIEVLPGEVAALSGSIINGEVKQTSFAIKGMYRLIVSVGASPVNKINNEKNIYSVSYAGLPVEKTIHFECEPAITESDGITPVANLPTYYYEWRINGAKVNNAVTEAFDWVLSPGDAKQNAYIDCIVYFKDGETVIGSACSTFKLEIID